MNPDLEKRVPREILEELIEEGTEAFRGILEKLFNVAMQLERSEFLGGGSVRENRQSARLSKRIQRERWTPSVGPLGGISKVDSAVLVAASKGNSERGRA